MSQNRVLFTHLAGFLPFFLCKHATFSSITSTRSIFCVCGNLFRREIPCEFRGMGDMASNGQVNGRAAASTPHLSLNRRTKNIRVKRLPPTHGGSQKQGLCQGFFCSCRIFSASAKVFLSLSRAKAFSSLSSWALTSSAFFQNSSLFLLST